MKLLFALLGLILVSYVSAQTLQEQCSAGDLEEGYYPHDRYCNKFFVCSVRLWRELTCANTYLFSEAKRACDYPQNVQCGALVSLWFISFKDRLPNFRNISDYSYC